MTHYPTYSPTKFAPYPSLVLYLDVSWTELGRLSSRPFGASFCTLSESMLSPVAWLAPRPAVEEPVSWMALGTASSTLLGTAFWMASGRMESLA